MPYFIVQSGHVYHWARDTTKYLGIKRKIRYGDQLRFNIEELVGAHSEEQRVYLTKAFEKAGIRYRTIRSDDAGYPSWSLLYGQPYGPQVDQIRQEWELLKFEKLKQSMKSMWSESGA